MEIRLQPLFGALIIFLMLSAGALQIKEQALQSRYDQEQTNAEKRLRQVAGAISQSINQRLQLTSSLAAFVTIERNFTQTQFERFAEQLQRNMIGVRSLQLAPDGIVKYLSNFESNREAHGHNLLQDKSLGDVIAQSIQERTYIIQGPYKLIQGGVGIVARRPLYFKQPGQGRDEFWGFATVIVGTQPILEDAGFFEFEKELAVAIRGKDGLGEDGEVFYGSESTFESPLAVANVSLPNASWQLAAVNYPEHVPPGFFSSDWYFLFSFISSCLLAIIAYSLFDRPRQLRRQVHLATENLRTTLNSIGDAVIATDVTGKIKLMNPVAEKLTGWSLDDAKNRPMTEVFRVVHDDTHKPIADPVKRVVRSGQGISLDSDSLLISKSGTEYQVADSAAPILDSAGVTTGVVLVFRDVTKDNAVQEELWQSENRFRRIFENADVSIWNEDMSGMFASIEELRHQGILNLREYFKENPKAVWEIVAKVKVIHVNEATLKMFGAKTESEFLFHIDETFGSGAIETFIDSLCAIWGKKRAFRKETNFKTIHGKPLRGIVSYQIPDTAEGFKSVPVSILDITERVQTEKALNRAQKMDAVGQLTGGIAHEFNNILGIILGNLDLLEPLLASDKKGLNRLQNVKHSAERAADLTKKLLGFARKNPGAVQITDINKINRDMDNLIVRSVTPEITVEQNLAEDLWTTEIDSGDYEAVLLNLILNARDAMPNGGKLVMETHNCMLDEEECSETPNMLPGEYVQLIVRDDGDGVLPENMERIFEPFFTTKIQGEGTGLGLALVFAFAKRSGGDITVVSESGVGTTFTLYLPRAKKMGQQNNHANKQLHAQPRGHETILVVDDEPGLVALAQEFLETLGYRVVTASDGQAALDILATEEKIHLLFSDIVMPGGIRGDELAARAREMNTSLKVLLTSGNSEKHDLLNRGTGSSLNLLAKPYELRDLAKRVRSILDGE